MPEFRTYAEMIAEANYPAVEGTYAALAERLTQQRDEARALADALAEALNVAINWIEPSMGGSDAKRRVEPALHAYREATHA